MLFSRFDNSRNETTWFPASGRVIRSDNPKGLPKPSAFTLSVAVEEDLSRYYRSLLMAETKADLIRPSWSPHITISKYNRTETRKIADLFVGKRVSFLYNPSTRLAGDMKNRQGHWYLSVKSTDIDNIRAAFGYPIFRESHITIAVFR